MSSVQPAPRYTVEEYLALERASSERHAYVDGRVTALAGESLEHGDVCTNLVRELSAQLRGTPCRVLSKDMKVLSGPAPAARRSRESFFSYPDVVVVCGEPRFHDDHRDVLLNPVVIIEVTSPSTEAFDPGEKWLRYQAWLGSLAHYLLVSQSRPLVEHFSRHPDSGWRYEALRTVAATATLAAIGCMLRLAEVYDRVTFAGDTGAAGGDPDVRRGPAMSDGRRVRVTSGTAGADARRAALSEEEVVMGWTPPTEADVARYFERLNNWGRWGKDDQKGTLNLVTAAKRAQAVALARTGRTVSLARDLTPMPALDYHMLYPLKRGEARAAIDYVGMIYHGLAVTHIDALCHVEYEGKLYNGRPFDDVVGNAGATWGALDVWFDGLVTRGVLLDVAALRPEGHVVPGKPVIPPDLDAAAERAGVRIEPGDVIVLRSGRESYERATGEVPPVVGSGVPAASSRPGVHIACLEWLRQHDIAALAWDMLDERPVGYGTLGFGVHLGIPILGLCLIDNTYPERLVHACAEERRSEFLFTAMPLRIAGSTGSPCNPVAIF